MIKEEFVTFETANPLREAGFPQNYQWNTIPLDSEGEITTHDDEDVVCYAPTQSSAMRWLREEKRLVIEPRPCWPYDGKTKCVIMKWCCVVLALLECPTVEEQATLINTLTYFPTYEAAAEAGIQAACEYLIEWQEGGAE